MVGITSPTLLISDDDRAMRDTLAALFEPQGFRTLAAADGREAIDIVRSEPVHVAVLDVHMPRLTGLEALQRINEIGDPLPCILMSAAWDETIRRAAIEAEAASLLEKPFPPSEIRSVVRDIFRQVYGWTE